MQKEFREQQRFNQWWLILILAGIVLVALFGFLQQVIFDKPFGNNPAPDLVITGFFIGSVLLAFGFFLLKLRTVINANTILVSFGIFGKKQVEWTNVARVEVVDYGFIGGWGLRYSQKYGKVYSTKGSKGLHIKLRNGSQFVVGTQRMDELKTFLNELNAKDSNSQSH